MTKHEIIDETVEFYSVPGRRSINPNTSVEMLRCLYNGPDGKHCAFARVVQNPECLQEGDTASSCINNDRVLFKEGYEGHHGSFWDEVQQLHDGDQYWNEGGGLSALGFEKVWRLKANWKE